MTKAINFNEENTDFARLSVTNLNEEHLVQEIKMDNDYQFYDPVFYVVNIANSKWVGISNPPIVKNLVSIDYNM